MIGIMYFNSTMRLPYIEVENTYFLYHNRSLYYNPLNLQHIDGWLSREETTVSIVEISSSGYALGLARNIALRDPWDDVGRAL